jgi:membrane peptidoglycan carboxypeptidase
MKYSVSMSKPKKVSKRKITKRKSPTSLNNYSRVRRYTTNMKSGRSKKKFGTRVSSKFKKSKLKKVLYISIATGFFLFCAGLIVIGVYLKNLQNSLPSPDRLVERTSDQSTQIFDRNGVLLYTVYGEQNREFVPIDEIPEYTKWAVLAAEDIEFYQHKGLDYLSIVMAAIQNVQKRTVVRGASTVTQQLVKNTILYDVLGDEAYEQKYSRKVKEVLITMQVEQTLSKDQILQMYMNEIPLGGVNYGFQAAAHAYFGKDVSELTLAESALIAGLIQSPGVYSPLFGTKPEMAKVRQEFVLDQMLKAKSLTGVTEEEIQAAKEEELVFTTKKIDIKAPHFVFYVKQLLEEEFGIDRVERGGLKVTTTLDYSVQEIAEDEVIKGISKVGLRYNVNNGATVVLNPTTGEILSMVGSVDYWNIEDPKVDGNVNVTTRERQMGSSAKPYVYLSAFSQGYGPWTLAPDLKMTFGTKYSPDNWDKKFEGVGTARRNLGRSRNTSAVYTLQMSGIDSFLQTVEKLGITTLRNKGDYGLALALGAGEMKMVEHAAAFGVFANQGIKNETNSILKVEDAKGNVLKESTVGEGKRVIDEKEIYLLNYILCDLGGHGDRLGTAYSRVSGTNVCFKTGTTDGPRDLTVVMYHRNLVVGVWTGNNDNTITPGAYSTTVPLPIAHGIMSRLADRYKPELFTRPAGILSTTVCTDTGATPAEGVDCNKEASVYIAGRAPQTDERESILVCKANGLIPTNLELAQSYDLLETKVYMPFELENRFQRDTYISNLIKGGVYLFEKPESGICPLPLGPDNAPVIEIVKPQSLEQFRKDDDMEISGSVRYLESIDEFTVQIDTLPISGVSVVNGNFSFSHSLSTLSVGDHTLVVSARDNFGKMDTKSVVFTVQPLEPIEPVFPAE